MAEKVELAWAEDMGWSVTVPSTDTFGGPTRYLHLELVPSPAVVAQFLTAVLLDGGEVGMPYPAHFRLRSQPLQPLLDALGRCGGSRERVGRDRQPNDLDQCLAVVACETSTARTSLYRDDHRAIKRR